MIRPQQQETTPYLKRHFGLRLDNFREGHELVDELLSHGLLDDVLVVVVAQSPAQLVVVHVVLVLPESPQPGHFLGVDQLKLPLLARPVDDVLVLVTQQELQQELPKCYVRVHDCGGRLETS